MKEMQTKSTYVFWLIIIIIFLLLSQPGRSYAYIDPNAGGFFFTSVLPFVYGILAAIVVFWKRIANFFKKIFSGEKEKK